MNKVIKRHRLKIISLLILGAGSLLFAASVFVPSTTPTLMVGQYALKNNDLLLGKTPAYRPWYENGAWQGDIIEYQILTDGTRQTDAAVGANPATAGANAMCRFSDADTSSGCWTARATFIANGADEPSGTYWQTRNIFTKNRDTGGQVDFTWDNLSATQRELVDKEKYDQILASNGGDATLAASDTSLNTAYASEILNYVRGKRLHEKINDAVAESNGNFRSRYSVLGDITSSPIFIGPPREPYGSLDKYIGFSTDYANRHGFVAVGANDGMLHVFDEDDGSEFFAYVPSMVLDKLGRLVGRDTTYDHTYYVAGELQSASAYFDSEWHTTLVGGGGPGFAGLYALDMTEDTYDPSLGSDNRLLFEKTSVDADNSIGHIYGKPQIGSVGYDSDKSPSWYIFSGNGYSITEGHKTALVIISLDDPDKICQIETTGSNGGLSAPALLNTDVDNMVELAFAGDIKGDLWMFELDPNDPCDTPSPIKVYEGSPDQPITAAPTIGKHPYESGYMVYFGTGSLLSLDDALNDGLRDGGTPGTQTDYTKKQSVYGIWIDTKNADTLTALVNNPYSLDADPPVLQTQTLVETTGTFNGVVENLRITPVENPLNYSCISDSVTCTENLYKGWKVDLPNCGERLIGSPFLRNKRIQFLTTNPTGPADACGSRRFPGDSWAMSLDWLNGASYDTVIYNLTPDADLNDLDKVSYNNILEAPVGINLGPGNIAQPTFARLTYGIDKMYINGIFLSIPPIPNPGPLLGGHIDVETDSPTDGMIATNNRDKHSEGYDIQDNDGLGGAVDGHVHAYDTMHDVDFVDLFQLEPRRGKANLVAAAEIGTCSTEENHKGIQVGTGCLEAIEGELNRAYDILHTDQDGVLEPNGADGYAVHQSEVNSLGADTDFIDPVPDTKFIITLANADRSNAAWIQIGCKAWPVVEYQNMITEKLLDGRDTTTDLENDGLVFTLEGIHNDFPNGKTDCITSPYSSHGITEELRDNKGLSIYPTLRIGFGRRSILDEGVHATRSQCVLGLHDPQDKVCYSDAAVLSAAESALLTTPQNPDYSYSSCTDFKGITIPPDDYIRDPARNLHITLARASELGHYLGDCGYRWRNGALTVQLIDAAINPSTDLQSLYRISGGGTHVKAYSVANCGDIDSQGNPNFGNNVLKPKVDEDGTPFDNTDLLLYEATMYWHYSDLVDKIRNSDPDSNTTPQDAPCYGDPQYGGKTTIDTGGLTLGEYNALTDPLEDECKNFDPDTAPEGKTVCDLERFGQLLDIIDSADSETILNQALLELAALLGQNQALADYAAMRDYAGDKIPEHHKLTIDQQQCDGGDCDDVDATSDDGTPNDIELYEDSTPELAGPNSVFGRRNWIDLRQ